MYSDAEASGRPRAMTVRSAVATPGGLPRLAGPAAGAAHRRGDRGLERVAAPAGVERTVLWSAGAASRHRRRSGGAPRGPRGTPGGARADSRRGHGSLERPRSAEVAVMRSVRRRMRGVVQGAERPRPRWGRHRACDTGRRMDPSRKRTIRLVVALSAAVVLASALIYTSFTASTEARNPSQLLASAVPGKSYELTGKVAEGSWTQRGAVNVFRVRDRDGHDSVPIRYAGSVPDPFREGREVVVTVSKRNGEWVGEKDSLITKCPSKFQTEAPKT